MRFDSLADHSPGRFAFTGLPYATTTNGAHCWDSLRDRAAPTFPCYGLTGVVVPGPMPVICTMTSSSLAPSKCTAFAGCFM